MAAKTTVVVHVVLDTNALFTDPADKLLATGISDFILSTRKDLEINVTWYLPSIVKAERQHQMTEKAIRLLAPLEKVETLLGHRLNITEESLRRSVEEVIKKQVALHGLKEVNLDHSKVDWQRMIEKSVFRLVPFARGETEKGFRDAVLLETFCQIVDTLPKLLKFAALCSLRTTSCSLKQRRNASQSEIMFLLLGSWKVSKRCLMHSPHS